MSKEQEVSQMIEELARTDVKKLIAYLPPKVIDRVKICIKRSHGLSYMQIAKQMNMSRATVQRRCGECG